MKELYEDDTSERIEKEILLAGIIKYEEFNDLEIKNDKGVKKDEEETIHNSVILT